LRCIIIFVGNEEKNNYFNNNNLTQKYGRRIDEELQPNQNHSQKNSPKTSQKGLLIEWVEGAEKGHQYFFKGV
jgi:hypothetical protein